MFKKRNSLILIGLSIAAFLSLAQWLGLNKASDRLFLDSLFRNQVQEYSSDDILIIAIDEKSLSYFGKQRVFWPWPREYYAVVINYLNQSGAKVVLMDLLLDTPDFDRLAYPGEASDMRLIEALERDENVILSLKTGEIDSGIGSPEVSQDLPEPLDFKECNLPTSENMFVSLPFPDFIRASAALGDTNIKTGVDGLIRNQNLVSYVNGYGYVPSLSLSGYLFIKGKKREIGCTEDHLLIDDNRIPVTDNFNYLINWYGKGGESGGTFTYYSYQQVMQDALGVILQSEIEPAIDPDLFKDKIIFIGANAAGLSDIKNTPVSSLADFPGVEIHATTLQNLLDQSYIRELQFGIILVITALLAMGSVFLFGYNRIRWSTLFLLILTAFISVCSAYLFFINQLKIPISLFLSTIIFAYTGSMAYNYFTEEREKRKISRAFNQYVQPQVVDEILAHPEKLKLGGEKKKITVLFSDLEGFTSISESIEPDSLISFLNVYLDSLSNVVLKNEGTIDKYIGDAIMAFWGAPLEVENEAEKACISALEMMSKMSELEGNFTDPVNFDLLTRFGINTGNVVVGNIGSQSRFDYTVLGDSVNLAARLESANKFYGTKIIISEFTYSELPDSFICRQLDLIRVKGKTEPVKIFELIDNSIYQNHSESLQNFIESFEEGLNFYYEKKWERAITEFEIALKIIDDDKPSQLYIKRCKDYKVHPPVESWDGVFEMKTK